MESILHQGELLRSAFPHWDTYMIDADNAFHSADRFKGLEQIREHFPQAFPFLKAMYLHDACQFVFFDGVVYNIPSRKGFHQGDVLGTWCYIMTLQPLLNALDQHLKQKFGEGKCRVMFFVVDGNLCGEHEAVLVAIKCLKQHGPSYGYNIKCNKGAYLIGTQEVSDRFARLSTFDDCKLDADNVHLHPDNLREVENEGLVLPVKYGGKTQAELVRSYGTKLLCSYVGSNELVRMNLFS